jgi:hypothetical protein
MQGRPRKGYPHFLRTNPSICSLVALFVVLSPGLTSCEDGKFSRSTPTPPAPSTTTVLLSPHLTALTRSQSQPLTAKISGGSATLTWFVDGLPGGNALVGTIASTGATTALYSPGPSTRPGSHSVTAKLSSGAISPAVSVVVTDLDAVFTYHNDNSRMGQTQRNTRLLPPASAPQPLGDSSPVIWTVQGMCTPSRFMQLI